MDLTRSRTSGILLHPSSLPGPFGIGDLGPAAYRFVDWLVSARQSLWQILPLGPTGYGNSPYMSLSAFGGNGLLIGLEGLLEEGLLEKPELAELPAFPADRVDYAAVVRYKVPLLRKAFQRFHERTAPRAPDDFYAFCEQNAFWLEDYALFAALKDAHEGRVWPTWERGASLREREALITWRNRLSEPLQFRKFVQYVFFKQWAALKRYCHANGIAIIGDIPIYVAHDSAEVWSNRDLFHLDEHGNPLVVAGVPPDYFSATGQRWGNPIYRWDLLDRTGYQWWIDRFRLNLSLVDVVRLDHFRGFEAYWEIPAADRTAVNGRWVKAPGARLFQAVRQALGEINVIAEDLGIITPEVDALRDRFGFPGMRILQMAFGTDPKASDYRPHHHVRTCAAYTATHDHNTTVGWFTTPPGSQTTQSPEEIADERRNALAYTGTDGSEIHWDFIRLALGSVAAVAIFPMQDVLGLGTESRLNRPGTLAGNWEWRVRGGALTQPVAERLAALSSAYERNLRPAAEQPTREDVVVIGADHAETDHRRWIPHPFG